MAAFNGNPGERAGGGGGNPRYNRNPPVHTPGAPVVGRPSRTDRQKVIYKAQTAVASALTRSMPGVSTAQALKFADIILTRPHVSIGQGGKIFYQGQRYTPEAFASSPLAKLATGQRASAENQAAITGDPDYINALAQLGLSRDQATAGLSDQQRQALIQFGDPTFAGGDQQTAAEAATNPFSTERLEAQQYQQSQAAQRNQANQLGVGAGGGALAGQQAAQQAYAAQTQDAVSKISALLSSIQEQEAAAQQAYGVGQSTAATDAYNALLASGAIHAAAPPAWSVGAYKVRPKVNAAVPGFAGPPGTVNRLPPTGLPGRIPPRSGNPGWGGGNPPVYEPPGAPKLPGQVPGNGYQPLTALPGVPTAADVLRRFGIGA